MMTRILMTIWAAAALLLGGCMSEQFRAGTVHDTIGAEMRQATAERSASDAATDKALLPPLAAEMPKAPSGPAAEPRFDLSVVNAPAAQVFMAIVTGTRYNMLVPPDVGGLVTVSLKDVTVREALDAIRELYGYEYVVKGNRITVQANTLQTRVFQINYLASHRLGTSELRVTSSSISGSGAGGGTASSSGVAPKPEGSGVTGQAAVSSSLTSRVQTNTDSDFWGGLTVALGAIVGDADGRKVVVNSQSGIVVISALPREIRQVESYLRATQTVVDREVMLEAKILDVALSQDYQAGINWGGFRSGNNSHGAIGVVAPGSTLTAATGGASAALNSSGVTVNPGRLGTIATTSLGNGLMGLALQTANFAALLNFLEGQGTVNVLSSPRIATINNQKAVLKVGTDELFVTGLTTTTTTSGTGGTVTTPTLTLQPYFSGISLDVTPQIDEDSNIVLHIHPAVSVVQEKQKVIDLGATLGTFQLPLASSSVNESDSIVRVRDGNIVAIGGLMTQSQTQDRSQLPGLGNTPGLGMLFGQRAASATKRELVILIKPTVISSDRAWFGDLEGTSERMQKLDPREFMGGDR
jgi:MSHA biogenesis protein MshL